jgi:large subunit ribosomal protein L25
MENAQVVQNVKTIHIEVRKRMLAGTSVAKKIRRAGLIPANVYGVGFDANVNIALDPRPLRRALVGPFGRNQIVSFELDGKVHIAMCRDVKLSAVSRELQHVDFVCVEPTTKIRVTLPIVFAGRSAGQKAGGRLDIAARYVKVDTTPVDLPANITVKLAPFKNGEQLGVEQLPFPAGVTPFFRRAFKVMELVPPKVVEVVAEDPKAKKKK